MSTSAGLSTTTSSSLPPASSTERVASGMSTSIEWGPAITASPLANSNLSSDDDKSRLHSGFSKSAKEITIATTVIGIVSYIRRAASRLTQITGGVIVVALLLYALRRRRRGATFSEIVRLRPHDPSSITLSPKPQDGRLTALPIHREWRISVHSSRQDCLSPKAAKRSAPVPPAIAQRFHSQNPYVKDLWRTAHPPSAPASPLPGAHSDPGVNLAPVKEPEMAHLDPSRLTAAGPLELDQQSSTRDAAHVCAELAIVDLQYASLPQHPELGAWASESHRRRASRAGPSAGGSATNSQEQGLAAKAGSTSDSKEAQQVEAE
ncbi:hypothetical protein LTR53_015762 [Teratosphaeriaceae sp. CCFEE 6253]|nr:hypothetical protein LTR53_015762 [Teratosphaeriaceae sp. CCFEE 6253]